jgi:hypothetical protein
MHAFIRTMARAVRLWQAWVVSIAVFAVLYAVAPQQIPLTLYKVSMCTMGGIIGYWVHVWCFGHIEDNAGDVEHAKWRRTAFMVGGMVALALAT